ncbi:MAG: hypothetical protein KKC75_05640 [Nanoarchaeota archaeon]|nr:hypothetical protein [Nanoarchaeota archaeon]MBU1945612.1 hypothetical protein [Nanoarchaeota archaeon]
MKAPAEVRVRRFVQEEGIDLDALTIAEVNRIRDEFDFKTRADVLAILKKNKDRSEILYSAYAADFYDRTEFLHEDRPEYKERDELILWLYRHKSRLEYKSLDFIAVALKEGGKINEETYDLWRSHIRPANYAARNKGLFTQEIIRVYKTMTQDERYVPEKRLRGNIMDRIDRDKFRRLNDAENTISEKYLRMALRYAFMFYGYDLITELSEKGSKP